MQNIDDHRYDILLGPNDPLAPQPERIRVPMKPHQRAALGKAKTMETKGTVKYNLLSPAEYILDPSARRRALFRGNLEIESNVGILGDMVGYGKTLTALSIIASNSVNQIYRKTKDMYCYHGRNYSHFTAICDRVEETEETNFIHTTLVIVPRGPVFVQWEKAIKEQTNLNALVIDNLPWIRKNMPPSGVAFEELRAYFEQFDVVLVKATTLKSLMDHYTNPYRSHPIQAWDRIMIDEAHDIISKIPLFSFRYLWLISATYKNMLMRIYAGRNFMSYAVRDIIDEERMNMVLLKGSTTFVMQSFNVPSMQEHYYLCSLPGHLSAVHGFLTSSVQERINAGDIQGAIKELGGHQEVEEDIVQLVTREIERDIRNKEAELAFINNLDIPEESKTNRSTTINQELNRLRERQKCLMERVTALSNKQCSICYDNYTNPIMLPCTHIFCGGCLLSWMKTGHVCPECRLPIQSRGLIAIVKDPAEIHHGNADRNQDEPKIMSKEDTLVKLIKDKPAGKFLVFSRCDYTFYRLMQRLDNERISHAEMKGSTATMMRVLDRFRDGELKVIMLNTHYAGSGIDISCATDVIMFHVMEDDGVQAIGRAQRVGRTSELHVHHLCYPQELSANNEP